jgi:L-fuculose-phosphate aldolase
VNLSRILTIKEQIIAVGRKLARAQLVCARSGNLSARFARGSILITASATLLGDLKYPDIVKVSLAGAVSGAVKRRPSSELPAHLAAYNNFDCQVVIHCHPPLVNAYFAVLPDLKALTFETRFYLKEVPVIAQRGVNVSDLKALIRALRKSRLVVVRNHGVFSVGDDFQQALERVLILEEAVKVAAVARLFKKKNLDKIDRQIKKCLLTRK